MDKQFIEQEISLDKYLKLGGDLKKVDWSKSYCDYGGKDYKAKVLYFKDKGEKSNAGNMLLHFHFDNGTTHRYAIQWIIVTVKLILPETYK
jgi:hypothetical protein